MNNERWLLQFSGQWLWLATGVAMIVLVVLTGWIWARMRSNGRKASRRSQIRKTWNNLLADLLMNEDEPDGCTILPTAFQKQLTDPFVRSVLAAELVSTCNSLRGAMAENVLALYNQLGLAEQSENLLRSKLWHRQVKGIQQLSAMAQHQFYDEFFESANHTNQWVRNAAQIALIRLRGAEGLQFLQSLQQPISEWQQFNLLHELQVHGTTHLPDLQAALSAQEPSVLVFAIRLCRQFQQFGYASTIIGLHSHAVGTVATEAAGCLREWGVEAPIVALNSEEITVAA